MFETPGHDSNDAIFALLVFGTSGKLNWSKAETNFTDLAETHLFRFFFYF